MSTGENVVSVKSGFLRRLRQAAVLADIICPLANLSNQANGNLGAHDF
jgi:hypothetical protein